MSVGEVHSLIPHLTIPAHATEKQRLETIMAEKNKTLPTISTVFFSRKKDTFSLLIYDTISHTSSFANDYLPFHPI